MDKQKEINKIRKDNKIKKDLEDTGFVVLNNSDIDLPDND